MASITAYGSKHSHEFTLKVDETSTSTSNNTSTISYEFSIYKSSYSWSGWNSISYTISINGTDYSGTIPSYSAGNRVVLKSGTQTVGHNSDGTKSIGFSFSVTDNSGQSYTCGNASANGSMQLTTIQRKSTINSVFGEDIEDYFSVSYTSYYNGFTNKLRISIPNVVALETFNYTSGTTFTLSQTTINYLYNYMKRSKTVTLGFVIETWNGNTKIGDSVELKKTCTITNCNPQIGTCTYLDTNGDISTITGDNQIIVRHLSTLQINLSNLTSYKGAHLSSCTVTINNITKSASSISGTTIQSAYIDFGEVDASSNVNAYIVLTDTRGNIATQTLTITIQDYIQLSINADMKRTQPTSGEIDVGFTGNYFNGNIGQTSNTLSIRWFYKESGTSTWILGGSLTPVISNNTYNNGNSRMSLGNGFNYRKNYDLYLEVKDTFTTLEPTFQVMQGIPIFNWGEDFFNINEEIKYKNEPLFEQIDDYSTTERRVGTWIDGKPLYEVTVCSLNLSTSTRVDYQSFTDYGISNVDFAFLFAGFTRYPSNDYTYPLHGANCTIQINGQSDKIVFINEQTAGRNEDIYGIIRYTKTTD